MAVVEVLWLFMGDLRNFCSILVIVCVHLAPSHLLPYFIRMAAYLFLPLSFCSLLFLLSLLFFVLFFLQFFQFFLSIFRLLLY